MRVGKELWSSSPTINPTLQGPPLSLSTRSTRFWNTSMDDDSATSLDSLFQCLAVHRIWGSASPVPSREEQSIPWSCCHSFWSKSGCSWPSCPPGHRWPSSPTLDQALFHWATFQPLHPSLYMRLLWSKGRTQHLAPLNPIQLASVHGSSLSRLLCTAFLPPSTATLWLSLVSPANWGCPRSPCPDQP